MLLAFFGNQSILNFYGFVPVALGGMGSNRGAVIGGLALGLFQQAANFLVGGIFAAVAVFVVFIVVLLLRPEGLCRRGHRASRVMDASAPPIAVRAAGPSRFARIEAVLPWAALAVAGVGLPLLDDSYFGVIAQRACIYWILVAGLNLVVGFAGQIAIGWVALLTLGAYTTAVLTAGTVTTEWNPFLALAVSAVGRCGLRRRRRPAGAPAAHLLLRHDDAGLRHHRHPGGAGLEERDRRRHRHAGPGVSLAVRPGLGLLLSLSHPGRTRHLDDGQHRAEAASAARWWRSATPRWPPKPRASPSPRS